MKRRALIVRGGWEGHTPEAITDEFVEFLRDEGFDLVIEDSLEVYADADLMQSLSLVIQSWTQGDILPEEFRGLSGAIDHGTGFVGWHGGVLDAFRQTVEFGQMIGGAFAAHPHGMVPYQVNIADAAHPITSGLSDFKVKSEQYWVLTDPLSTVLATTEIPRRANDPWIAPYRSPAAWVRQWGQGRIFICTPGHTVDEIRIPELRTMITRGMLWAAA